MHLGFALDLLDVDTRDIDLSDTDLSLLDADILINHFVGLQDMSWRRLQYVNTFAEYQYTINHERNIEEKRNQTTDG